jgi:hypothetical protein
MCRCQYVCSHPKVYVFGPGPSSMAPQLHLFYCLHLHGMALRGGEVEHMQRLCI